MLNIFSNKAGIGLSLAVFTIFAPGSVCWAEEGGGQRSTVLSRADVDGLLAQARSQMAAGKLTEADLLVRRAESIKVRYPVLHFGDTPTRVRQELDRLIKKSGNTGDEAGRLRLKNPLAVLLPKSKPPTADPFAVAGANNAAGSVVMQSGATGPVQVQNSPRELSDRALLAARQALAFGDASRAQRFLDNARQQQVAYGPGEDSPERVALAIEEIQQLTATQADTPAWKQSYAKFLVAQASSLVQWGDYSSAERTANEALALQAPLGPGATRPSDVLAQIEQLRVRKNGVLSKDTSVQPAQLLLPSGNALVEVGADSGTGSRVSQNSLPKQRPYETDSSAKKLPLSLSSQAQPLSPRMPQTPRMAQATPSAAAELLPPGASDPYELLEQGEKALRSGDRNRALRQFQLAYEQRTELDPQTREQLQGHLQMLSAKPAGSTPRSMGQSFLNSTTNGQTVVARQLSAEIGKSQSEAARLRSSDPKAALEILQKAVDSIASSELDANMKSQLSRRVELSVSEVEQYISDHRAELELDEANREVLEEVERRRAVKGQVQEKMAELIDQFNTLREEQRYGEMEIVANRLYAMAPEEPVAQQVWMNAKFIRRTMLNREIKDMTEEGVVSAFQGIRKDAAESLLKLDTPIDYGNWNALVEGRRGSTNPGSRMSPRELEIQRKLRTLVLPRYDGMPLSQVMDGLSDLTGVNIYLDPLGLGQEAVQSDRQVTLNLSQEISLESALNLILVPLHLTFMIKDDVLKITSEQIRDGDLETITYNVADLVVPIPNFVPNTNMGLQGLINDAYATVASVRHGGIGSSGPVSMVAGGQNDSAMNGNALAQQLGGTNPGGGQPPISSGVGGPGGLGGAAAADFDSLIDLIVSTVEFDSWMENGTGEGEIRPFPTNLSLVISQTQSVHEKVADLLEQLRRLQDLQVTIEVRFIRLSDNFFERIGVDFDFNIRGADGNFATATANALTNTGPSATVGIASDGVLNDQLGLPSFTADLDVPFRQGSFGLATPQFATPQDVGQFGFAILSDIEAFFLINASQGDARANVLNAPKVTLFNGQQAIIVDTAFRPFVISVIPVVGEFAAAQQPVIVVLSEGTTMTVQAVVSDDRRYVRLTIVPFFSQIGEVTTFTFEGSETTAASSETIDDDDDGNDETNNQANTITRSGTTVQLPTFQVISVATTVSVPDGGTVLLGGIKRLREQRNEFGIPLLGKVPYIDRLFRNVGISRETNSLMMMVTPHIIIQEEEEERLGIINE